MNRKSDFQNSSKSYTIATHTVWELESGKSKIVDPSLEKTSYGMGMALYVVDADFCKKWFERNENEL